MILQKTKHFTQRLYPAGQPVPADAGLYLRLLAHFESHGNFLWEKIAPGVTIHAVLEGKGTVCCNGTPFEAGAGDLFIHRKGNNYRYFDTKSTPWKYIYIYLEGSLAESCMKALGLAPENPIFPIPFTHPFWVKLQLLTQEFDQHQMTGVASVRAAWELFELMKNHHDSSNTVPKKETLAEVAKGIIESSSQAITNVNDLAAALHVSRVTLFRSFKERYNQSIKEFIEQTRFERIEPLLKNSDLLIQEIAHIAGFNDPLYFSRAFRKRYGTSPTEWRAQNQYKHSRY